MVTFFHFPASYPLQGHINTNKRRWVMYDVDCMGTELDLSDCNARMPRSADRFSGDAGVLCTSKFYGVIVCN